MLPKTMTVFMADSWEGSTLQLHEASILVKAKNTIRNVIGIVENETASYSET